LYYIHILYCVSGWTKSCCTGSSHHWCPKIWQNPFDRSKLCPFHFISYSNMYTILYAHLFHCILTHIHIRQLMKWLQELLTIKQLMPNLAMSHAYNVLANCLSLFVPNKWIRACKHPLSHPLFSIHNYTIYKLIFFWQVHYWFWRIWWLCVRCYWNFWALQMPWQLFHTGIHWLYSWWWSIISTR
jgi:hypothetical protein